MNTTTEIISVTVYSDRAQIIRKGSAKLSEGVNLVKIGNLSPYLITNSVQAKIIGEATLKELKSLLPQQKTIDIEPYKDEIQKLENQIAAFQDQKKVIANEQELLNQLLTNLSSPTKQSMINDFDLEKWNQMTQYNRQRQLDLGAELRTIKPKLKAAEKELADLREKAAAEIQAARAEEKGVELWIESEVEQEIEFEISYLATNASWSPQYDINIVPNDKKIQISYNAIIRQATDEDWSNVKLHLSTAKVSEKGFPPKVNTERIWLEDENNYYGAAEMEEAKEMAMPASESRSLMKAKKSAAPAAPKPQPQHKVDNFLTTVNFDAAERTSIVSSREDHKKVAIMQMEFPVEFKYTTAPKLSSFTYLKARLKNDSEFPLLSGSSNVFLGNSFVTSSKVVLTQPNEETWVFLGVDETVKIERQLVQKKKAHGGFLKKNKISFKYNLKISNSQSKDISITVWEPLPLSEDKSLVVELNQPKIIKGREDVKLTDKNIIEWEINIEANKSEKLPVEYSIEYPLHHVIGGIDLDFDE